MADKIESIEERKVSVKEILDERNVKKKGKENEKIGQEIRRETNE